MFEDYNRYKIFIYYTEDQAPFLKWAKVYWLVKTAHPIEFLKLSKPDHTQTSFQNWINTNIPKFTAQSGLYVPVTIRPLLDIDFLQDADTSNRMAQCQDGSLIFCIHQLTNDDMINVSITNVFEDFSPVELHTKINEEIDILRNKLCLNI